MPGQDFYDEIGALFAKLPSCAEDMKQVLTTFLAILQRHEDVVSFGSTLHNACYSFVEAAYFEEYKDKIVEHLTEISIHTHSERELNVIYTVFYFVLQEHSKGCNEEQKSSLLKKLKYEAVNTQAYGTQLPALLLLDEICRSPNLTSADLALLDENFIDSLLDLLEYNDCYCSYVIDALLDVILSLFSQFERFTELNRVVSAISRRLETSPTFRQKLVLTSTISRRADQTSTKSLEIRRLLEKLNAEKQDGAVTPVVIKAASKSEIQPILTQS
ncbi:hypothetical protein K493DRAFT_314261 [Basidiobolus meristosporus CBS 931.73]|uniref:SPIN90/Ldb17 leucine-rich domain-containing protein n=1 Tax=Basidiobolus meristosporus CBS 931.73 TaxID=1314790 RepID=A0A1Y1YG38_9FUNG|nr:hypothetical protein K493DRAFT_314261 [Basidiobolus meristosporus CBS 931.73]|eukprot:ORX96981.1 hypothetical protein K493DRAFT_314261 [Basidiobolus meristosporus CBS 931.73]